MAHELLQHDGWILCRNLQQIPVPGMSVLLRWAERGRVRPDDFLVNPALECCLRARDFAVLNRIFRQGRPLLAFLDRLREVVSRSVVWTLAPQSGQGTLSRPGM